MKTRILSGIMMGIIVAAVLLLGIKVSSVFITLFIAVLASMAIYELLKNVAKVTSKSATVGAMAFAFLFIFAKSDWLTAIRPIYNIITGKNVAVISFEPYLTLKEFLPAIICVVFFLFAVFMVLKNHKDFGLSQICMLCGLPFPVVYAFNSLGGVLNSGDTIYYLLLLFNFSSICDMGAYFSGVTLGKHKLCPEISPKKTVEGAVGGILSSIIFGIVFCLAFSHSDKLLATILLTIPLCIVGMLGDLFASAIKRSVGLKDYSNLIPGHGGILDRLDSMLLISPLLNLFILMGVL